MDKKVYPWLVNGLIRAHIPHLRDTHLPFFGLQKVVTIIIAWCVVPATIGHFALGYLVRHDLIGTGFHLALFAICVGMAFSFYFNAVATLKGQKLRPYLWREASNDPRTRYGMYAAGMTAMIWVVIFLGPFRLPSANLSSANLRGANLAFAGLQNAMMDGADVRSAQLSHARLNEALLFSAQLDNANLTRANLSGADLKAASLLGANLTDSRLDGADLRGAQLQGTIFTGASLRDANLARADLTDVLGLTGPQLCQAETMIGATLDAELVANITTDCVELLMGPQEN